MSLLARIREDAITARKARDPKAGILVTLIGEADTAMKSMKAPRPLEDSEIVAILRKFIKNIDDTITALRAAGSAQAALDKAMAERTALEVYLPVQMSAAEIEEFARAAAAGGANLGGIMAKLKAEKAGRYDGKLASTIVRETLATA